VAAQPGKRHLGGAAGYGFVVDKGARGKYCGHGACGIGFSYDAEIEALLQALNQLAGEEGQKICIATDSKSSVDRIASLRATSSKERNLMEALHKLLRKNTVAIWHVRAHRGIRRNEDADGLASQGSQEQIQLRPQIRQVTDKMAKRETRERRNDSRKKTMREAESHWVRWASFVVNQNMGPLWEAERRIGVWAVRALAGYLSVASVPLQVVYSNAEKVLAADAEVGKTHGKLWSLGPTVQAALSFGRAMGDFPGEAKAEGQLQTADARLRSITQKRRMMVVERTRQGVIVK
jgi:ribonuclease HI